MGKSDSTGREGTRNAEGIFCRLEDGGDLCAISQRRGDGSAHDSGYSEEFHGGTSHCGILGQLHQKYLERDRGQASDVGLSPTTGERSPFQAACEGAGVGEGITRTTNIPDRTASYSGASKNDRPHESSDAEHSQREPGNGVLRQSGGGDRLADLQSRLGSGRGLPSRLRGRGGVLCAEEKERHGPTGAVHQDSRRDTAGSSTQVDAGLQPGSERKVHTGNVTGCCLSVLSAALSEDADSAEQSDDGGASLGCAVQLPTAHVTSDDELGSEGEHGDAGGGPKTLHWLINEARRDFCGYQCGSSGAGPILTERAWFRSSWTEIHGTNGSDAALRYGESCARLELAGGEGIDLDYEYNLASVFGGRPRSTLAAPSWEEYQRFGVDTAEDESWFEIEHWQQSRNIRNASKDHHERITGQMFVVLAVKLDKPHEYCDPAGEQDKVYKCEISGYTNNERRKFSATRIPPPSSTLLLKIGLQQAQLQFPSGDTLELRYEPEALAALQGKPRASLVRFDRQQQLDWDINGNFRWNWDHGMTIKLEYEWFIVLGVSTETWTKPRPVQNFGSYPNPYKLQDVTFKCRITGYNTNETRTSVQDRVNRGKEDEGDPEYPDVPDPYLIAIERITIESQQIERERVVFLHRCQNLWKAQPFQTTVLQQVALMYDQASRDQQRQFGMTIHLADWGPEEDREDARTYLVLEWKLRLERHGSVSPRSPTYSPVGYASPEPQPGYLQRMATSPISPSETLQSATESSCSTQSLAVERPSTTQQHERPPHQP